MSREILTDEPELLRGKAIKYRELAAEFSDSGMRDGMLEMALNYEARADAIESELR